MGRSGPALCAAQSCQGSPPSLAAARRLPQRAVPAVSAAMAARPVTLGIDLGTTSVKAALLEAAPGHPSGFVVLASCARAARAETASVAAGPQGKEQDVSTIIQALNECLDALPRQQLQRVGGIGVSGQMHGILFWKAGQGCEWTEGGPGLVFEPRAVSHLITWQDGRCNSGFLASLPKPASHLSVATGFGCATIFWLLKNSPEFLKSYDAAGTIQDYVVAMLCGLPRPLMSDQNAASWGYFNTQSQSWNLEILEVAGFPVHLLPDIAEPGSVAGRTFHTWFEIPKGTQVGVALGDLQASVYSCMGQRTDAGLEVEESAVYSRMIQAAAQQKDTHLTITPTVLGERHLPDQLASVTRISSSDLSLGHVTRALCRGIVQNLHSMLPFQQLKEWGVERVMGSGSALSRNEVLKQEVQRAFPLPVCFGQDVDAAFGAALVMLQRDLSQKVL
ncbi:sedoheptulokinase isoform X2 [Psammomys obesus]|uniref:sedoheptulokinase isoform X2 n=1 Tax=Psammomys obesus TaxID=48139 RepID=UPI0024529A6C|nr:sedoheptulokinase isoform X2 [Psammomys obesus]